MEVMKNKIEEQLKDCYEKYGKYVSMHEAMGVLKEEYEELWDICKQKPKDRKFQEVQKEIIDCIVVLIKMYYDIVLIKNIR